MKIFIDADGCPVVDLTIQIAKRNNIEVIIVCDTSHYFNIEGVKTIVVSKGADSVDFKIVNILNSGDLVVTQDYGLAAMCLARKAVPISQNGFIYDESNIDALLLARHTSAKIRKGGGRLKGATKRTNQDNDKFVKLLEEIVKKG